VIIDKIYTETNSQCNECLEKCKVSSKTLSKVAEKQKNMNDGVRRRMVHI
jgi:Na+-translocating ferredoxin:NAD+ oxidoreductase RNF subunit RnfB